MFNGKLTIMGSVTNQSAISLLFIVFIRHLRFACNGLWWTKLNEYASDMTNTLIKFYTSFITFFFFVFVAHLCYIGVLCNHCKDNQKTSIKLYTSFLPFVFLCLLNVFVTLGFCK